MRAEIEDFGTGWFGVRLGLRHQDIELLILRLEQLRVAPLGEHFHLRGNYQGAGGVADVEIYLEEATAKNTLDLE